MTTIDRVLLSVRAQWCGLIASGKRTIDIRKTKPNIETPFKVLIYCTNDKKHHFWIGKQHSYIDSRRHDISDKDGNGKIIGEYICDMIINHCETENSRGACGANSCSNTSTTKVAQSFTAGIFRN